MNRIRRLAIAALVVPAAATLVLSWPIEDWLSRHEHALTVLSAMVVAIFTGFLWRSTHELSKASAKQAVDTRTSIDTAVKALAAAETQTANAAMEMRAFLTIKFQLSVFQEITGDGENRHFEGQVYVINAGKTPARNVRYRTGCAILPGPIAVGTVPTYDRDSVPTAAIGPGNNLSIFAALPDMILETDVPAVKRGQPRAFCTWGEVIYEDVFGTSHYTRFRFATIWRTDGSMYASFTPDYNDLD